MGSDPEQLAALRALGMRSVMIVPMRLGEETLGALTLVTADSGRRFSDADTSGWSSSSTFQLIRRSSKSIAFASRLRSL